MVNINTQSGLQIEIEALAKRLVLASANCRAFCGSREYAQALNTDMSLHPYWRFQRDGLSASHNIGRLFRRYGLPLKMWFWELLLPEYQSTVKEHWERGRRVEFTAPTLDELLQAIEVENTIVTPNVSFNFKRREDADDDYGLPTVYSVYQCRLMDFSSAKEYHCSDWELAHILFESHYGRSPTKVDFGPVSIWHSEHRHIFEC
jgi:hypothetical protein